MRNYSLLVPPGYQLVDLEADTADACSEIASKLVIGMPTQGRAKAKQLIRTTLSNSLAGMAKDGSFAALISIAPLAEQALRPTVVFSRFRPSEGTQPLDAVVSLAAAEPSATLLEINDLVGVRVERRDQVSVPEELLDSRLPADLLAIADETPGGRQRLIAGAGARVARRVHYFLGSPDDDLSWVQIQAGVQVADDGAGRALGDALVELFDAVTKTFRWEGDEND